MLFADIRSLIDMDYMDALQIVDLGHHLVISYDSLIFKKEYMDEPIWNKLAECGILR
jgi:hypothetical protein